MDGKGEQLLDAVLGRRVNALPYILGDGVDVNYQNKYGWSALMCSAQIGRDDIVEMLLDHQVDGKHVVDVNIRNDGGTTALMYAAQKGHTDIVERLLAYQVDGRPVVDVNVQDTSGRTALMMAISNVFNEDKLNSIVRMLLAHQVDGQYVVDVNARSKYDNKTALEKVYAHMTGVKRLLLAHPGTQVDPKWLHTQPAFPPPVASDSQLLSLMIGVEPALLNSLRPKRKRTRRQTQQQHRLLQQQRPPSTLAALPYALVVDEVLPKCKFDPIDQLDDEMAVLSYRMHHLPGLWSVWDDNDATNA